MMSPSNAITEQAKRSPVLKRLSIPRGASAGKLTADTLGEGRSKGVGHAGADRPLRTNCPGRPSED